MCNGAGDVVFALDSSGSVGEASWLLSLNFITGVIQNLDLDSALNPNSLTGSRVGFLIFGTDVTIAFQLNTYSNKFDLLQGLQQLYVAGQTNTAKAIQLVNLCILKLYK